MKETLVSTEKYEHKYKDIVELTGKRYYPGYDFNKWKIVNKNILMIQFHLKLPDNDVEVRCYYNIETFQSRWKN